MKVFKYKINGSPYKVVVQNADETTVELEVNGTPYVVEIEQSKKKPVSRIQRQTVSSSQPFAPVANKPVAKSSTAAAGSIVVNSPLPGIIFDLFVKVGDTVKKGDTIVVLEAMKMENNVQSPSDGKISRVSVIKGDAVLEGAELVVIE